MRTNTQIYLTKVITLQFLMSNANLEGEKTKETKK